MGAFVDERRWVAADGCYQTCTSSARLEIITVYVGPMREFIVNS